MENYIKSKTVKNEVLLEEIIKKLKKFIPKKTIDYTDPKEFKSFCREYSKYTTPGLRAVDLHQARSMEYSFTRLVR